MNKNLILAATLALVSHAAAQAPAKPAAPAVPAANAEALYRQGLAAEKAGDPEAARKAYTEALKANPNHANARFSLGQLKLNSTAIAAKGREAKFGSVMVPEYKLDSASLRESLDALQMIVEKQSKDKVTPNFVIKDPGDKLGAAKISLQLKSLPARAVLQYVLEQVNAKARYDEHAIVIEPK